ncbi:MAG: hypothetical protein EU547_04990 [Promethearchaeota archaeon]|nr:MAG: hypothetical protein EU547_04990 [Candidatus Lokiarchaeota archaeon]
MIKVKKGHRIYEINIKEFLDLIGREYRLKFKPDFSVIDEGEVNLHLIIEDKLQKFAVRVFRDDKTLADINSDLFLLKSLNESNFPTPKIFATKNNKLFVKYQNYPVSIFEYIDGTIPKYNVKTFQKLGSDLAMLHSFQNKIKIKESGLYNRGNRITEMKKLIKNHLKELEIYCEEPTFSVIKETYDKIKNLKFNDCKRGLIHGDVVFHNLKQTKNGKIYFLDFDDAGIGPLILDFVLPICYECTNFNRIKPDIRDLELNRNLLKAYLKGYFKTKKFSHSEIEKLWDACGFRIMDFIYWMIWRIINDKKEMDSKIIDHWKLFLFLKDIYPRIKKEVLNFNN